MPVLLIRLGMTVLTLLLTWADCDNLILLLSDAGICSESDGICTPVCRSCMNVRLLNLGWSSIMTGMGELHWTPRLATREACLGVRCLALGLSFTLHLCLFNFWKSSRCPHDSGPITCEDVVVWLYSVNLLLDFSSFLQSPLWLVGEDDLRKSSVSDFEILIMFEGDTNTVRMMNNTHLQSTLSPQQNVHERNHHQQLQSHDPRLTSRHLKLQSD